MTRKNPDENEEKNERNRRRSEIQISRDRLLYIKLSQSWWSVWRKTARKQILMVILWDLNIRSTESCSYYYYDSTPYSYQVRDWACRWIFSINKNSHNKAFFSFFSAALFSMDPQPSHLWNLLTSWCRIDLRCLIHFPFLLLFYSVFSTEYYF